jgi:hypothetical protein
VVVVPVAVAAVADAVLAAPAAHRRVAAAETASPHFSRGFGSRLEIEVAKGRFFRHNSVIET